MFGIKKKNPFDSLPFHYRGTVYDALVRYSQFLFQKLDRNGAFDDNGNFVSENDWEIDTYNRLQTTEDLIKKMFEIPH